jgi:hypothetical protein
MSSYVAVVGGLSSIHVCAVKEGKGGGCFVKPYALEYILGKIDNRTMRE